MGLFRGIGIAILWLAFRETRAKNNAKQKFKDRSRGDQSKFSTRTKNSFSLFSRYGNCFKCEGSGKITLNCKICDGSGVFRGACRKCNATGIFQILERSCRTCNGTGDFHGRTCLKCTGSGIFKPARDVRCDRCSGWGSISSSCKKCGGAGTFVVSCRKCGGSGWHKF